MTPEERSKLRIDRTPRNIFSVFFGRSYQLSAWTSWSPEQLEEEVKNGSWLNVEGHLYAVIDTVPAPGAKDTHPESIFVRLASITGFAIGKPDVKSGLLSVEPKIPRDIVRKM